MLKRFRGIYSTCPSKMDIFFDVLPETFDRKLAFVVYFREERQVRLGRNLRERACLVTVSSDDSYTESNARYHREDQVKSKEALFGQESFVHSLKCKSMTLYSSGVKGPARPSFGARADCYDCEVSGPSTTTGLWSV